MGFIADLRLFKKKPSVLNSYRFDGLHCRKCGNYYTMQRVSDDKEKIVLWVIDGQVDKTRRRYHLYLDCNTVVILENWQISKSSEGYEVLLFKNDFQPCNTFKRNRLLDKNEEQTHFVYLLHVAQNQHPVQWYDEELKEYDEK